MGHRIKRIFWQFLIRKIDHGLGMCQRPHKTRPPGLINSAQHSGRLAKGLATLPSVSALIRSAAFRAVRSILSFIKLRRVNSPGSAKRVPGGTDRAKDRRHDGHAAMNMQFDNVLAGETSGPGNRQATVERVTSVGFPSVVRWACRGGSNASPSTREE